METDKYFQQLRPLGFQVEKFKKVSEFRKDWTHLTVVYDGELSNKQNVKITLYFWVLPSFEQQVNLRLSSYKIFDIS